MASQTKTVERLQRISSASISRAPANDALQHAMQLAQAVPGSELHITYSSSPSGDVHSAAKLDALNAELQSKAHLLRTRVEETCAAGQDPRQIGQDIVFHVRIGPPGRSAACKVAIDVDANLIVVARTAAAAWRSCCSGSVAGSARAHRAPARVIAHSKDFGGARRSERPSPARPGEDCTLRRSRSRLHRAQAGKLAYLGLADRATGARQGRHERCAGRPCSRGRRSLLAVDRAFEAAGEAVCTLPLRRADAYVLG